MALSDDSFYTHYAEFSEAPFEEEESVPGLPKTIAYERLPESADRKNRRCNNGRRLDNRRSSSRRSFTIAFAIDLPSSSTSTVQEEPLQSLPDYQTRTPLQPVEQLSLIQSPNYRNIQHSGMNTSFPGPDKDTGFQFVTKRSLSPSSSFALAELQNLRRQRQETEAQFAESFLNRYIAELLPENNNSYEPQNKSDKRLKKKSLSATCLSFTDPATIIDGFCKPESPPSNTFSKEFSCILLSSMKPQSNRSGVRRSVLKRIIELHELEGSSSSAQSVTSTSMETLFLSLSDSSWEQHSSHSNASFHGDEKSTNTDNSTSGMASTTPNHVLLPGAFTSSSSCKSQNNSTLVDYNELSNSSYYSVYSDLDIPLSCCETLFHSFCEKKSRTSLSASSCLLTTTIPAVPSSLAPFVFGGRKRDRFDLASTQASILKNPTCGR